MMASLEQLREVIAALGECKHVQPPTRLVREAAGQGGEGRGLWRLLSLFALAATAAEPASLRVVNTALVSRKVFARLMPLMAPSRRFMLAVPLRPFFSAAL